MDEDENESKLNLGRLVTMVDYMKELARIAKDTAQVEAVTEDASSRFLSYFEEAVEAMGINDQEMLELIEDVYPEDEVDSAPDPFGVEDVPDHADKMVLIVVVKLSEFLGDSLIGQRVSITGPRPVDGLVVGMNNLFWTIGQLPRRAETVFESILFPVELLGQSRVLVLAEDENGPIKI